MAKLANRWFIASLSVSFGLLVTIPTAAQPSKAPPRSTTAPSPSGAYDKLSPAQRKIADALYEAQNTNGATTPLTRDQIAAQKNGKRWNDVFRSMKAQGLLQERNIGQVMSSYAQRHRAGSTVGAKPPTANRGGRSKTTIEKESKRKAEPDSVRATSDGTPRDDAVDGAATSPERGGAPGRRGSRNK